MRKSLLAVAVLGAFAGTAMAADVTLYGVVDTGFMYSNVKKQGEKSTNTFEMKSGMSAGSRWGIKGTEDLGNGYKVGFVLESGFDSDTGNLGFNGRVFGRQATLNVSGPFGEIHAGRMGAIGGGSGGPMSLWGLGSAFGTTWANNSVTATLQSNAARYDNSIGYISPKFAGLQVFAMYSMGGNSVATKNAKGEGTLSADAKENAGRSNRYYGLGVKYANGPLTLFGVVDQQNYDNRFNKPDNDDSLAATLGGSYDFGFMKLYAAGQYFDNLKVSQTISAPGLKVAKAPAEPNDSISIDGTKYANGGQQEGYALSVSVNVPVAGGDFKAQLGYADAEDVSDSQFDGKRYVCGIGYAYPLSKRTMVYTGASYMYDKVNSIKEEAKVTTKTKTTQVFAGLKHTF